MVFYISGLQHVGRDQALSVQHGVGREGDIVGEVV